MAGEIAACSPRRRAKIGPETDDTGPAFGDHLAAAAELKRLGGR
jgi:hypothetical protein